MAMYLIFKPGLSSLQTTSVLSSHLKLHTSTIPSTLEASLAKIDSSPGFIAYNPVCI
jgi:hypothetical protein